MTILAASFLEASRKREFVKYERSYQSPKYKMGEKRKLDAFNDIRNLPCRTSYLDVSCGKGETLDYATKLGFQKVQGTEIVSTLLNPPRVVRAEVHALPFEDQSFDVATMFDVIEHLIKGDDKSACLELKRVAAKHILITANNRPSFNMFKDDLHINKRPYPEWDALFKGWFAGATVTWIRGKRNYVSECWRIDL